MNARYWDHYKVDGLPKFPHQAQLGQKLSTFSPDLSIESNRWNPLTVLLLVANESLSTFRNYTEEKSASLRTYEETTIQRLGFEPTGINRQATSRRFDSSGSGIAAPQVTLSFLKSSEVAPLIRGNNNWLPMGFRETPQEFQIDIPENLIYYPIKAHMPVYSFFNNFASALDRLAHELTPLYGINLHSTKIDWNALAKPDKSGISKLGVRDQTFATIYSSYQAYFDKSFRYRNVLAHHGYLQIEVEIDNVTGKWYVFLPDDPDDKNSATSVDAVDYISSELGRLINFLDTIYAHILGKLTTSSPPW